MEDIEIRLLTVADVALVEKFLKEEYYTREPSRSHLEVPIDESWTREESVVQGCLEEKISYGAFDKKNGSFCAISLNILGTNDSKFNHDGPFTVPMRQFISLLQADGMHKYMENSRTRNYMELYILCVKDGFEKRGLATKLSEMSIERAREKDCEYIAIGCLSAYSRKIAEKLNFKLIREVVYENYVDPLSGEMVLKGIAKPHYASTFLCLDL